MNDPLIKENIEMIHKSSLRRHNHFSLYSNKPFKDLVITKLGNKIPVYKRYVPETTVLHEQLVNCENFPNLSALSLIKISPLSLLPCVRNNHFKSRSIFSSVHSCQFLMGNYDDIYASFKDHSLKLTQS